MNKTVVVRISGEALDALRTGGTVLLAHQNTIWGLGTYLKEPVNFPRSSRDDDVKEAWADWERSRA